jgi:hypothetical protein
VNRKSTVSKEEVRSARSATDKDRLKQAEICCEQAREAASRKRFTSACGLFSTAIALYQQAIALGGGSHLEAEEHLSHLQAEVVAYSELAKSMDRPLLTCTVHPVGVSSTGVPDARLQMNNTLHG